MKKRCPCCTSGMWERGWRINIPADEVEDMFGVAMTQHYVHSLNTCGVVLRSYRGYTCCSPRVEHHPYGIMLDFPEVVSKYSKSSG